MRNNERILGDIDTHVHIITDELAQYKISTNDLAMLDHLCYRVETDERYEEMKRALGEIAVLRAESPVQGRMISIFELHDYLKVPGRTPESKSWKIPYIELPAPKEGSPYKEGLEHAEFVVVGSLERFRDKYSDVPLDTKAMDRPLNPELGLKTDRAAMKFHKLQIGAVVDIETLYP